MPKKKLSHATRSNNPNPLPSYIRVKQKKLKSGHVETYWSVRINVGAKGQQKFIERGCKRDSLTDAADVYRALQEELAQEAHELAQKTPRQIENRDRTFGELAD